MVHGRESKSFPNILEGELNEFLRKAEEGALRDVFGLDFNEVEIFLLNALRNVDFVGELPFGQATFGYFCDVIQSNFVRGLG